MKSTHIAQLDIAALPESAGAVHLFPDSELVIGSLISVPALCDANLTATFTKSKCYITSDVVDAKPVGHVIMEGDRSEATGLWTIPLSVGADDNHVSAPPATSCAAPAVKTFATTRARCAWFQAAMGSPCPTTFYKAALDGGLPFELSASTIKKYASYTEATAMGHLDRERQGQRSTKSLWQRKSREQ